MKLANVRRFNDNEVVRLPFDDQAGKYDPALFFLKYEESAYMNDALGDIPWLDVITDDLNYLENINLHGFKYEGEKYVAIFVVWRDNFGKAICVPVSSGVKNLRDVGIIVELGSMADTGKASKYVNRIIAAPPKGKRLVHGTLQEESSFVETEDRTPLVLETYLLDNGKEIRIIYDDMETYDDDTKACVDGALTCGPEAAMALELTEDPRSGDAWRVTFGTHQGTGKGHMELIPTMGNYVRIYGPKRLVKTEGFTFSTMGALHVGIPHTDPQAFWNFDFDRPELSIELARKFMRSVLKAAEDEDALRETFLRYSWSEDGSGEPDLEGWMLRKALAYNIPIVSREDAASGGRVPGHPGLFRRVISYLMKKVMDCERARIPMDGVAVYGYVLPDPFIFDPFGTPDLRRSRLDAGELVMPDLEPGTDVVVYRQPSENDNAHFFLRTVYSDGYRAYRGRGICLLGRGAKDVLRRLGGGDMDDMFVIVHDPVWVKAFEGLYYPETEKLIPVSKRAEAIYEGDEFFEELMSSMPDRPLPGEYGKRQFSYQIEQARKAGVGIGPVVNMGGIDKLLSQPRHKQHILDHLEALDKAGTDVTAIYSWYVDRVPYQAAKYMTNLEIVIDGNVKDETLLDVLGNVTEDVKLFHENLRMYPICMANRIPQKKREKADYVLVETLMCKALKGIAGMRDQLTEAFREREWLIVGPADQYVVSFFPKDDVVEQIVKEIRIVWQEEWKKVFEQGLTEDDRNAAYGRIEGIIEKMLEGYDTDNMQEIAVELYRRVYRKEYVAATTNAEGRRQTFPDSLLWTRKIGNALLEAFRTAGVAGLTVGVELLPEFRHLRRGKIAVTLSNGVVTRTKTGEQIGFCARPAARADKAKNIIVNVIPYPDGEYVMSGGVITFKKSTLGQE